MARRNADKRRPKPATKRQFPRTARLNTLLQQIIADHLERVDDDRLGFLTVTGVEVDADLNRAQVWVSALADESQDAEILGALEQHRKPIQGAIARSARLRKTPEVVFAFDPAVRAGARIESILSQIRTDDPGEADAPGEAGGPEVGGPEVGDAAASEAAASGEVGAPEVGDGSGEAGDGGGRP
ncbi:MAG: 30S ribosome-binding factor RbfA [Acidimicrobiales bacterium]